MVGSDTSIEQRFVELARALRVELERGVPSPLVSTVHACIVDLEIAANGPLPESRVIMLASQGQTLLQVCRAARGE